ncbi:Nuclear factor erythroid 2 factor 3 [Paragonimus heterotremus]|uniref:Nuclear factor erythroid 2 factor 3 n=1 Tax=Paragonimus heterotremus TaxID=100268 RepID=A0A8J4WTU7_9TREM|nr:Nuclear factor erythroid 2 factor 3 [Paragonimus heterotremus]
MKETIRKLVACPHSTRGVPVKPTQWRFRQVDVSVNNVEEETSHVSGLASCSSLTDEVIVDNYKVVPDEWICSSLSQTSDKSSNAPLKSESRSSNPTPRMSRRKAVLKPCNVEQRRNRNISLSSGSDLNKSSVFQGGSSSDSELDYRPTGSSEWRSGYPFPCRRRTTHRSDLCLGDSFSHRSTPSESDSCSLKTVRKSYGSSRSPGELNGTSDCDTNNLSYCPSTSSNKRPERHLRDVLALEEFKIPFSYDEIIYSTNEQFRELKATPNLTQDQINMMLDARKRATNRQAAERCRRLKTATRDELSERLCALRLERQILTRQIAHARQRKQRACDALLAEQKRVLALLRGPDGNQLKYSDWHVRLTHDDEVVLVAVGR